MFWNFSLECWTDLLIDISIAKATSMHKKQKNSRGPNFACHCKLVLKLVKVL